MLQFYKPNKNNTGGAATFSFNSKGDSKGVFVEVIKQNGWNPEGRNGQGNGVFKDGVRQNTKLSLVEVAAMVRAIENDFEGVPAMVHTSQKGTKTIRFYQWGKDKDGKGEFRGWALGVNSKDENGQEVKAGCSFSYDEVVLLREFLKFALVHVFTGLYSDTLARAKEYAKNKEEAASGGAKGAAKPAKSKDAPKTAEEFVDNSGSEDVPF